MSLKIKLSALTQRVFRVPVVAYFASEHLGKDHQMQTETMHFIGVFRALTDTEIGDNLKRADDLRNSAGLTAGKLVEERIRNVNQYLVGIEKHPEHDFPILDDSGAPATITPELKLSILYQPEIRDAVELAYKNARDGDVLSKNLIA